MNSLQFSSSTFHWGTELILKIWPIVSVEEAWEEVPEETLRVSQCYLYQSKMEISLSCSRTAWSGFIRTCDPVHMFVNVEHPNVRLELVYKVFLLQHILASILILIDCWTKIWEYSQIFSMLHIPSLTLYYVDVKLCQCAVECIKMMQGSHGRSAFKKRFHFAEIFIREKTFVFCIVSGGKSNAVLFYHVQRLLEIICDDMSHRLLTPFQISSKLSHRLYEFPPFLPISDFVTFSACNNVSQPFWRRA